MPRKPVTESKEKPTQNIDQTSVNKISQVALKGNKSFVEVASQDNNTKEILQIAANALIAEYNAIRAASLARDQIFSSVANFGIVLIAAILASLPTIISQQRY